MRYYVESGPESTGVREIVRLNGSGPHVAAAVALQKAEFCQTTVTLGPEILVSQTDGTEVTSIESAWFVKNVGPDLPLGPELHLVK